MSHAVSSVGKSFGNIFNGVLEVFTGPKPPKPPDVPDAPTIDQAEQSQIESRRLLRRRGRGATILSSPGSRSGSVGINHLLGGGA